MRQIRPAENADIFQIYRFICQLEEKDFDFEIFETGFKSNLLNSNNIYLVAETAGGELAGFLSSHCQFLLHHNGWVYEIQELFVDEKFRNQKIGGQLLKELERQINIRGHRFIDVTSNAHREKAHRFYLNNGYKQTHVKFTKKFHSQPNETKSK